MSTTETPTGKKKGTGGRPKATPVTARSRAGNKENQGPVSNGGEAQAVTPNTDANLALQALMERMARMEGQLHMF
jgi:hypothetical protein